MKTIPADACAGDLATSDAHKFKEAANVTATTDTAMNRTMLMLGRWAVAIAAVLAITLFAYHEWMGSRVLPTVQNAADSPPPKPAMTPGLRALVEKTQVAPNDADAWAKLGHAHLAARQFAEAAQALEKATRLREDDAQLWVDYATAVGSSQGERLSGEPEALVQRALKLNPKHPNALAMAGLAASERGEMAAASNYWRQAIDVVPAGSPLADSLRTALAGVQAGSEVREAASKSSEEAVLIVDLGVDRSLQGKAKPGDSVFVDVRSADRPGVTVALARKMIQDAGSMEVRLDDSHSLDKQLLLSSAGKVIVHARISRAGFAMAEPGDLLGESPATSSKGRTAVLIDKIQR
ncbi:MAG TPA: hypothetical protein VLI72_08170 [Methylibium sp.]|nr:hypothetical protein [Methylibium sp.]